MSTESQAPKPSDGESWFIKKKRKPIGVVRAQIRAHNGDIWTLAMETDHGYTRDLVEGVDFDFLQAIPPQNQPR